MPDSESLWLVLPLPNRALSPNARVHHFQKREAARKARRLAREAVEGLNVNNLPWPSCRVSVKLYYKTDRKRDQDNAVAMLKSTYDGIVDAGVVTDDTPDKMARDWPKMLVDKAAPRMELLITKQGENDQ